MMREILFRGKRQEIGDWVEGSLITYPDGDCFIARPSGDPNVLDKFYVDPETVGQFTGLTDKNGTKIFEGDIVKCYDIFGRKDGSGIVSWSDLFISWNAGETKNMYGQGLMTYEVIGNIHGNPELLEV